MMTVSSEGKDWSHRYYGCGEMGVEWLVMERVMGSVMGRMIEVGRWCVGRCGWVGCGDEWWGGDEGDQVCGAREWGDVVGDGGVEVSVVRGFGKGMGLGM